MTDGITIRVLGDYGPFSRMGKSIGYQATIGGSSFLIDCGAPLFQQVGGFGLKAISGLIVTHCHDDHKRWFTDLALFYRYAPDIQKKVPLFTSEEIKDELLRCSGPALDRSLSADSKRIVDIDFEDYIEFRPLGPRAKYSIRTRDEGGGRSSLYVADRDGNPVGPDGAKIIISSKTGRPRLLFKDPAYKEWVEPESFYPFSSGVFYEEDRNVYAAPEGFTVEAIKSPVWHGITGIGLRFKTPGETFVFSSDTVHDIGLWRELCEEKRPLRPPMPKREFEAASVIRGDINDFIERTWSAERFEDAVETFEGAVVVHDIATRNSVVHTDYKCLAGSTMLKKDMAILTHGPDTLTSEWVLSRAEKHFKVKGGVFYEIVGGELYPFNADIYHKEAGGYFVGFRSEYGPYTVYEVDGHLLLSPDDMPELGKPLYRVELFEDIGGKYFPKLDDKNSMYLERKDGHVERLTFNGGGSNGTLVENVRAELAKKYPPGRK